MLVRKHLVRVFLISIVIFSTLMLFYFMFRGFILDKVVHRVETKLKEDYSVSLKIEEAVFSGMSTIRMYNVSLTRAGQEELFKADTLIFEPSLSALLAAEVKIKSFYLSGASLSLVCSQGKCNYPSIKNAQKSEMAASPANRTDYSSMLYKMLRKAFNLAPQKADIHNFSFSLKTDSVDERISVPFYHADKDSLQGLVQDDKSGFRWKWTGNFSQKQETFNISLFPLTRSVQKLPLLHSAIQMDCSLDTVHVALYDLHYGNGCLDLNGHFSAENLRVFHPKISQDTVNLAHMILNAKVVVGDRWIEIDSSTSFQLNSIHVFPFARLLNNQYKIVDVKIRTEPTEATDFFYSLPEGIFEEVRDIEGDGTLAYSLDFHMDTGLPDSLQFESSMQKSRFHLTKFGDGNLLKLNTSFRHFVYENDRLIRSFIVGPENPAYTPIDSISGFFQSAVLTSEDGNFYFHNGFNEDAFRKSIALNYKAGRFVRGGSTISMQLVKNVFLTRKKTIARKAEEALIVWLLENNRLVSKRRMLEVYFNIIELGPGIYGIGEASEFYFAKKPAELNLAESIFLASLLPHPKWYRSSFDEQGNLKPYLFDYYRVMSNFMLKKNLITQEDYDALKPEIILRGPARDFVIQNDSLRTDIEMQNMNEEK